MPNPGPPNVLMQFPWRLHSVVGSAVDFYFDVIGQPQWTRPEESRGLGPGLSHCSSKHSSPGGLCD